MWWDDALCSHGMVFCLTLLNQQTWPTITTKIFATLEMFYILWKSHHQDRWGLSVLRRALILLPVSSPHHMKLATARKSFSYVWEPGMFHKHLTISALMNEFEWFPKDLSEKKLLPSFWAYNTFRNSNATCVRRLAVRFSIAYFADVAALGSIKVHLMNPLCLHFTCSWWCL
jgi:hypothetical protein